MAGKTYLKTGTNQWSRIKKIYLKTGGQTWSPIRKVYLKVSDSGTTGRWRKVYDTASNRPFIVGNDIPKIRLNTPRTNSPLDFAGTIDDPVNPFVEAPPVQQMGPTSTSPSYGWPYESIGRHLWGYDGTWASGNGSTITYARQWLYNYSGNANDNQFDPALNLSSTGRDDMLTNLSAYLGRPFGGVPGGYFDRNFLSFRVTATNSAGPVSSESAMTYIVKEQPTGSITMIEPDIASPNTTMSASFSMSNNWYKTVERDQSYIEWFAVDNLTDTLSTANRVQIEYLNTFTYSQDTETATTLTGTTYHVPTLINKYYFVRITLNNSNTLPAKYNGNIININGFVPNTAPVYQANKTAKTSAANGPFNLTNAVKTSRYYDATSTTWKRNLSVNIGQSSSATQYEVQIEGQYSGVNGSYSTTDASWVVLQTLSVAPYVMESSRVGGVLPYSYTALNYMNYRFTARSRNGTSLNGAAYSNGGTSTSLVYVTAPAVAPNAPVISNIATSSDTLGSFITFNNSVSSFGSNVSWYYEYSLDNGSNWNSAASNMGFIGDTNGKLYVTAGATINLRIRATNTDVITSSQSNLLSIVAFVTPSAPTSVVVRSFAATQGTIFFTAGSNTQSVQGYLEYDSFSNFDSINNYVNVSSGSAAKIQLTGANSQSITYTSKLLPYSAQNKTGGTGTVTSYSTKVLNGSDNMTVNLGTPTRPSDRTISLSWTATGGAPSHYVCRLYNFSTGAVVSTKTILANTTSISFNSLDGVVYSTVYYIGVQPQYQYTASVTYEDANFVSSNINSGANLTAPTSTSISSISRLNDTTIRAVISSSGGSGPYYQMYWIAGTTAPTTTNYDAASTTSTVTEDFSFATGITYYFYIRSSNENLGNTINGGTATDGTYSAYGPTTGAANYAFAVPTSASASITGSTSVGSTLTLTPSVVGGAPTPTITVINWRIANGGTGGNSYTGGTIMQQGGTTFVIPATAASISTVGYQIRAEVTYNNGLTTNVSANSNSITVTAAASPPTNTSLPTLSPTTIAVGTTLTAGIGTWSGTTPITYDLRIYRGTAGVVTSETLVKSAGNVTSTTYTITQADYDSGQRYFRTYVNATNSAGSSGFVAGQERGPAGTAPVSAPTNTSQPTLSGGLTVGNTLTFGVGSWSGSPTSYALRLYRGTAGVVTSETLVKNAGNVTSSTYVTTQADYDSGQRYFRAFATATNSGGTSNGGTFTPGQEIGPIAAGSPATAPGTPGTPTNGWSGGLSYPFSWTAPTPGTVSGGGAATITSYSIRIYRASSGTGTGATLYNTYSSTSASYTFAAPDTQYYAAAVAATNSAGLTGNYSGISQYK
jgi:hypothetical protein